MTLERVTPGKPGGPPRSSEEMQERNREMRDLRHLGLTLQEIGDRYELTRERVRQIVGDEPTPPPINSYDPFTTSHKKLIRDILDLGVTQPELGLSGFGLVGKPHKKRGSDLQTGFCRNLFYDLQDLIIVYAYRDGATITELHEMFERAGCRGVYGSTISRLRDNGFDLPHRTVGTDWIAHGHERLPSEGS